MVFSSLQFVLGFMPIFFIVYYISPSGYKNIILLFGSLAFYFIGTANHPYHFILFTASILSDFAVGHCIEKFGKFKKTFLILDVGFHLLCLGVFKYGGFITGELSALFGNENPLANFVLPIGISFYTFQGISYIADVYLGKCKAEKSLLSYAVYISMFEQLIAGPIVTYGSVKKALCSRRITPRSALYGFAVFVFGVGLKVLLANPLGKLWTQAKTIGFESISTPLAWLALAAYSFQIYFDFFGYSLMALGLGRMLGFRLPKNFDHPYTAVTMTDFWRRWHITLGSWFREYVYIPLGGNRRGKYKTVLNLLTVWILTGIWHGAGYNFLLWGLIIFVLISAEKFLIGDFLSSHRTLGHLYMIIVIPLTWAVFAISDMGQLSLFFTRLFPFFGEGAWSVFRYDYLKYASEYCPFLIAGVIFSTKLPYRILKAVKNRAVTAVFLAAIFTASLYCMYKGFDDPFLYFRF